jgi:hypothetical protein
MKRFLFMMELYIIFYVKSVEEMVESFKNYFNKKH